MSTKSGKQLVYYVMAREPRRKIYVTQAQTRVHSPIFADPAGSGTKCVPDVQFKSDTSLLDIALKKFGLTECYLAPEPGEQVSHHLAAQIELDYLEKHAQ